MEYKELIESHPLYRRLSGQVIWLMFEERGARENDIQAFLDLYETGKRKNLELMAAALDEGNEYAGLLLETARNQRLCERCRRVCGAAVDLSRADIAGWFPPFGLGCALIARLIGKDEWAAMDSRALAPAGQSPPQPELICGEWIFDYPWSEAEAAQVSPWSP